MKDPYERTKDLPFEQLLQRYESVVSENDRLKEENESLKARLGIQEVPPVVDTEELQPETAVVLSVLSSEESIPHPAVTATSEVPEKIRLFMSLFRGRDDVYAKRWEGKNNDNFGYSPVCLNEWEKGVCRKPRGTCAGCGNKAYARLDDKTVKAHLLGEMIVGVYPMFPDESCWFLAIDFDKGEWQKDVSALRDVCREMKIPVSVERSRSGNGCHAWIFFDSLVPASLARKLGTSLLTRATSRRHDITFKSYGRFFPNQDTMPREVMGTLHSDEGDLESPG